LIELHLSEPTFRRCTVIVSVLSVVDSAISNSQHSTSGSDFHSPPTVVAPPHRCRTSFTDDHDTNMAADNIVWSPAEVDGQQSDRYPGSADDGCLPVTVGMARTVEERSSILERTSNANGVCGSRLPSAADGAKASHLPRSGGLHRRLNAIVRDRIIFFTKKNRSTSAKS